MDYQILEILNKKKFSAPEVLHLIIFRILKVVLFCLCLSFLFWFFLLQNYLYFTLLLGILLGSIVEIIINTRRKLKAKQNFMRDEQTEA